MLIHTSLQRPKYSTHIPRSPISHTFATSSSILQRRQSSHIPVLNSDDEDFDAEIPILSTSTSSSTSKPTTPPTTTLPNDEDVQWIKRAILSLCASLDRGLSATPDQVSRLDSLISQLQAAAGPVTLTWTTPSDSSSPSSPNNNNKSGMQLLDGRWRLIFSSGFAATGSLGGMRPGPSSSSVSPLFSLGQVYQDIWVGKSELDNVVELTLKPTLASLPSFISDTLDARQPQATARLRHSFEVVGAGTVRIVFEDTEVKVTGGVGGWLDNLPKLVAPRLPDVLQPPSSMRGATFDVVYLDDEMRVTRGDRGEVRVFLKGMI